MERREKRIEGEETPTIQQSLETTQSIPDKGATQIGEAIKSMALNSMSNWIICEFCDEIKTIGQKCPWCKEEENRVINPITKSLFFELGNYKDFCLVSLATEEFYEEILETISNSFGHTSLNSFEETYNDLLIDFLDDALDVEKLSGLSKVKNYVIERFISKYEGIREEDL